MNNYCSACQPLPHVQGDMSGDMATLWGPGMPPNASNLHFQRNHLSEKLHLDTCLMPETKNLPRFIPNNVTKYLGSVPAKNTENEKQKTMEMYRIRVVKLHYMEAIKRTTIAVHIRPSPVCRAP